MKKLKEIKIDKKKLKKYCENLTKERNIFKQKLLDFHEKSLSHDELKIIISKNSIFNDNTYFSSNDNYELYSFLYEYANMYGRNCTDKEYDIFANDFTLNIFYLKDFYFHKMIGQDTVIHIHEQIMSDVEFVEVTGLTTAEDIFTTKTY